MRKISILTAVFLFFTILLTGCGFRRERGFFNTSTSYFNNYHTESDKDSWQISGNVHLSETVPYLLYVEPKQEMEVHVTGTLTRKKGECELVYINSDSIETVIAQCGDDKTTEIDELVMLDQGRGSFAFTGDQADYGFDLKISGLDADKLDYIGNTDSDEDIGDDETVQIEDVLEDSLEELSEVETIDMESPYETKMSEVIGETEQTLTEVKEDYTVLQLYLEEEAEILLDADIYASSLMTGMKLKEFQLSCIPETGSGVILIEHEGTDSAFAGFEWQGHYHETIKLPAGSSKIVLSAVDGKNYKLKIKVRAGLE